MVIHNGKKLKLGLALGSGGAKGAALIGALTVFEEENVKFDCVSGTSIGSVVGALYAQGYSAYDITNLIAEIGIRDPRMLLFTAVSVRSLKEGLTRLFGGAEFSDLKKPFCAVATNLDTGEEVDINSGDLASAVAGSCAIQPVFRAVMRDGKRLVDGAFVNSVPADQVKNFGADFIVSINLAKGKNDNGEIKRILDDIYPGNGVKFGVRNKPCYEYSDVVIEPELSRFTASSITAFDEMYIAGYNAAKEKITKIKQFINNER